MISARQERKARRDRKAMQDLQVREAALADTQKTFSNAAFEQAVINMTAFAHDRPASVTQQVGAARALGKRH